MDWRAERRVTWSLTIIAAAALLALLKIGATILAPMVLALVTGAVLSPLSDFWQRRGFPRVVGAMFGLLGTLTVLGGLILILQPLVVQLLAEAPKIWSDMQGAIRTIQRILQEVFRLAGTVQEAVSASPEATAPAAQAAPAESIASPIMTTALLAAPTILSQVLIYGGVLFFFLLSRRDIYQWMAVRFVHEESLVQCVLMLLRAERVVSRYFVTVSAINTAVGVLTAVALQVLGMPGAVLWGIVAVILNFVPYLGPAICMAGLTFSGIAAFDGAAALAPVMIYIALNTLESQFVTPTLVGRIGELNGLVMFVTLVTGVWLWGVIGGIVAAPVLLWVLVLGKSLPRARAASPPVQDHSHEA